MGVLVPLGAIALLLGVTLASFGFFDLAILACIGGGGMLLIKQIWPLFSESTRLTEAFALTRAAFVLEGKTYHWGEILECVDRESHLVLLLTDGSTIVFGNNLERNKVDSRAVQWLCAAINHHAALAGSDADLPEAIKLMRRQTDRIGTLK